MTGYKLSMPSNWTAIATKYDPLQAGSIDGTDTDPHDRAVIRAMQATYTPNHLVRGDPNSTLFVGRLNPKTTEDKLNEVFSRHVDFKTLRLVRDVVTGFSKRYAFIEYKSPDDARLVLRRSSELEIDGEKVFVEYENERTMKGWIPRRLGGGFGGNKESGQLRFGGTDRPFRKPIMVQLEMKETSSGRGSLRLLEDDQTNEKDNRYKDEGRDRSRRDRYDGSDSDRQRGRNYDYKRKESYDRYRHRERSRDRRIGRDRSRERKRSRDRSRSKSRDRRHKKSKRRDRSREKSIVGHDKVDNDLVDIQQYDSSKHRSHKKHKRKRSKSKDDR